MPSYRVEIAKTGRAGCQATECKKQEKKIVKGDLRHGVLVEIKETQSFKYRHWGCVTPEVLHNWKDLVTSGGEGDIDEELIDGFDELPDAAQEKVKRAIEQEHVDDDEWNGDMEMNRWTGKRNAGMFLKGKAKKEKEEAEAEADDAEDKDDEPNTKKTKGKKTAGRKRSKKEADGDEDDESEAQDAKPAIKKSRAKKVSKTDDAESDTPVRANSKKPRKPSKKAATPDAEDDEEEEEAKPAPVKAKATKSKATRKPRAKKITSGDDD